MITGDIKNIAESYSDDADKVRDDQVVVMEAVQPALMIIKKVDKTTYKVGDISCDHLLKCCLIYYQKFIFVTDIFSCDDLKFSKILIYYDLTLLGDIFPIVFYTDL